MPPLRNCASDSSSMSWAMLRFRPIAPKPQDLKDKVAALKNTTSSIKTRTKRKYVRVRPRAEAKTSLPPTEISGVEDHGSWPEKEEKEKEKAAVSETLQLMPLPPKKSEVKMVEAGWVIKTWIVVDCVKDMMSGGDELGFTDWEKMKNLGVDRCPGFVSDGGHKVVWINEAYRKMVGAKEKEKEGITPMVWVSLKMKEETTLLLMGKGGSSSSSRRFACCRVRMSEQTMDGRFQKNRVMTCHVWRMDLQEPLLAWRLDITTALSLALPTPPTPSIHFL